MCLGVIAVAEKALPYLAVTVSKRRQKLPLRLLGAA